MRRFRGSLASLASQEDLVEVMATVRAAGVEERDHGEEVDEAGPSPARPRPGPISGPVGLGLLRLTLTPTPRLTLRRMRTGAREHRGVTSPPGPVRRRTWAAVGAGAVLSHDRLGWLVMSFLALL